MSSKEQFKDALKNEKRIIADLKLQLMNKEERIANLQSLNHQLKNQLAGLPENYKLKKWYQFWK